MPIEVTALAKKLGLPETAFESESTFEQAFNDPKTGYIPRARITEDETVKSLVTNGFGTRMGQLEALTRKVFKDEFEIEELESGPIETMLVDGTKKLKSKLHKIKEDATKGVDTRISELSIQAAEYKGKYESEKERAENANKLFQEKTAEFDNYKTTLKANQLFEKELGQIEFIPDMTPLQRKGYNALVAETYDFKLSEDGSELEVYTKADNKRAKNEAGNQNVALVDALKSLADKNGLLRKNNLNRGNTQPYIPPTTNGTEERVSRTQQTLAKNPRINS